MLTQHIVFYFIRYKKINYYNAKRQFLFFYNEIFIAEM